MPMHMDMHMDIHMGKGWWEPLTALRRAREQCTRLGKSLFLRTFFLLAVLLVGSILAWLQTLRALEFEPRTLQTAQQIAALLNPTALGHRLTEELTQRLGPDTIVAQSVNGEDGLWVGFDINGAPNWL